MTVQGQTTNKAEEIILERYDSIKVHFIIQQTCLMGRCGQVGKTSNLFIFLVMILLSDNGKFGQALGVCPLKTFASAK